jgi:hypothetical protein
MFIQNFISPFVFLALRSSEVVAGAEMRPTWQQGKSALDTQILSLSYYQL